MNNNKKYVQIILDSDERFSIESNLKPIELLGILRYVEKKVWMDMINTATGSTNVKEDNIFKEMTNEN
jgi:hypothetical protein